MVAFLGEFAISGKLLKILYKIKDIWGVFHEILFKNYTKFSITLNFRKFMSLIYIFFSKDITVLKLEDT